MRKPLHEKKLSAQDVLVELESTHWESRLIEKNDQTKKTKFRPYAEQNFSEYTKKKKTQRRNIDEKWKKIIEEMHETSRECDYDYEDEE